MRAAVEDETGYHHFLHFLVNDCIYLLDEAIKLLPELKRGEDESTRSITALCAPCPWSFHPRNLYF